VTPEQWRLIQQIFHEALDQPLDRRPAFLDRACGGNSDLRESVERMLAADAARSDLFDAVPASLGEFVSAADLKAGKADLITGPGVSVVGRTLAKYHILSPIGAGSMGEVYLARDIGLDRQVALKLLPRRFTRDPERVDRFVREARAASALNHPNILTIYEVDQVDGIWFIATEFVDGVSLRQRLAAGPMELPEALELVLQCAAALETAHRAGIIHRDLKPENVMVRLDGVVKVVDFGLARMAPQTGIGADAGATEPGLVMGTPRYMSPEQARGESVDARTDIYSLTAVLYEMVAGRPLIPGDTTAEVFASLLNTAAIPSVSEVERLPHGRDLQRILTRGAHKDREARYQTMQELAADLGALQTELRQRTAPGSVTLRRFSRTAAALLAMAAAMAVATFTGVVHLPRSPQAPALIGSVAVLPFINLSSDPEREYLVDGLTDQLITDLARGTSLRVISRTSVMQYKGRSQLLPVIARALNVDAIIEGSVRRGDGRIYLTAQLLDARADRHLWAQNYDRAESELLALPGEVARDVSTALGTPAGRQVVRERTAAPAAYDAYLRGRQAWNRRTPDGYRQALDYFNDAVDKDPAYGPAYAGLADTYLLLGEYLIWPVEDAFPRARAAAAKAIALDDGLAEPYAALGQINADEWRWADADLEFQRALERNPGYATGRQWRAEYLAVSGRADEALAEIRRAQALDPLSLIINTQLGWILTIARQPQAAIDQLRRTIEMAPRFVQAHTNLGIAYAVANDHAAALEAFKQAAEISGSTDPKLWMARELALLGRSGEARSIIDRERPVVEKGNASPSTVALVYLALGDVDTALSWMRQGCKRRSVGPAVYPPFDSIRSDPRFAAIMKCMHLPLQAG
jgi:eukaryotic-like serine/threonine-protein kinase